MTTFGTFHSDIENELEARGFHILDKRKAQTPGNYPGPFPEFPKLHKVKLNTSYIIRLFVRDTTQRTDRVDSGLIAIIIKKIHGYLYTGIIKTVLPPDFPVSKGSKLILTVDQILYAQSDQD
jgi:hypothetical protein